MTIEEFRNFRWKAGMRITGKNGLSEEIDAVFFNHTTVVMDISTFVHDEIVSILNPDGSVAWPENQDAIQCPCCEGSGSIPKEGSIVDEIRALEWDTKDQFGRFCYFCEAYQSQGHADDCPLAAVLRRLK